MTAPFSNFIYQAKHTFVEGRKISPSYTQHVLFSKSDEKCTNWEIMNVTIIHSVSPKKLLSEQYFSKSVTFNIITSIIIELITEWDYQPAQILLFTSCLSLI